MTIATTATPMLAEQPSVLAGRSSAWTAYLFLAPFLLVYLVFLVYPLFKGFCISLHDRELFGGYRE
jgi:multiple sugar transport system permease protein